MTKVNKSFELYIPVLFGNVVMKTLSPFAVSTRGHFMSEDGLILPWMSEHCQVKLL